MKNAVQSRVSASRRRPSLRGLLTRVLLSR
jgi:hypothetical protein